MSDSKSRAAPLWDGSQEGSGPLRRPKSVANSSTQEHDNSQTSNVDESVSNTLNTSPKEQKDIISASKLSVNAEEWFPPGYKDVRQNTVPKSTHSVQNRLLKYKVPESITMADTSSEYTINDGSDPEFFDEATENLQRVQDIISRVTEDPGEYDKISGMFCTIVEPYFKDVTFISNLVNLIVEQALINSNFRYSAARLCLCLEKECPLFRSALHLSCQKKTEEFPSCPGLALFLAELYAQLHYENLYGKYLLECLKNLLHQYHQHKENPVFSENVKVICQALKLTGSSLEAYNPATVSDIFAQLEGIKSQLPDSLKTLVQHVITLRYTNWGQQIPESQINSSPLSTEMNGWLTNDGPVFYGPDGKELTSEERRFLIENCEYPDIIEEDSDNEDWVLNPEMDEEVQIAFRQFLQQNN